MSIWAAFWDTLCHFDVKNERGPCRMTGKDTLLQMELSQLNICKVLGWHHWLNAVLSTNLYFCALEAVKRRVSFFFFCHSVFESVSLRSVVIYARKFETLSFYKHTLKEKVVFVETQIWHENTLLRYPKHCNFNPGTRYK